MDRRLRRFISGEDIWKHTSCCQYQKAVGLNLQRTPLTDCKTVMWITLLNYEVGALGKYLKTAQSCNILSGSPVLNLLPGWMQPGLFNYCCCHYGCRGRREKLSYTADSYVRSH